MVLCTKTFEVEFAGQAFRCIDKGFAENERVDVVIRPEDVVVGDYPTSPISGEVESVIFEGVRCAITVDAHGYKWLIHSTAEPASWCAHRHECPVRKISTS